ncbi:hypothetical protein LCGC14_1696930 [marine sediment metagenome]|uniref:Glycoside hydrolase family 5 domain-containing protein n=1 Tax=marine sediment metagenome TaxID=412755 RepID=A0A0F9KJ57_9ZZZZ
MKYLSLLLIFIFSISCVINDESINIEPKTNSYNNTKRGYTIVVDEFDIKDFEVLKKQNVNLVRCMLFRTWTSNNKQDLTLYQKWLNKELNKLDLIVEKAKEYNIKVIIDLHTIPGELYQDGSNRLFYEKQYAEYYVNVWQQIASRYGENSIVYAFELFNEPVELNTNKTVFYNHIELQTQAAKAIRKIDSKTPIIFSSNLWNGPEPFFETPISEISNVIYSVHFYYDMSYTHQGIDGFSQDIKSYPKKYGIWAFDKNEMIKKLEKVRQFQIDNNAKIFVGEFSVVRWAEGSSEWLEDAISIFENYGWDWTYHSWCNYHNNNDVTSLWSLEAKDGSWGNYDTEISEVPTNRKKIVLKAFEKNK